MILIVEYYLVWLIKYHSNKTKESTEPQPSPVRGKWRATFRNNNSLSLWRFREHFFWECMSPKVHELDERWRCQCLSSPALPDREAAAQRFVFPPLGVFGLSECGSSKQTMRKPLCFHRYFTIDGETGQDLSWGERVQYWNIFRPLDSIQRNPQN